MGDNKNHLYTPEDAVRDRKNANKRKEQQQFSRFSIALATSVNNATIQSVSPALQRETKPQIGDPYDDTKGSVSTNQIIDLSVYGSNYIFCTVTGNFAFTFDNLPTGRHMQFVVDIIVNNPSGVNITFPQVANPPVLAGDDGDRYVLEFVGVVKSDPQGLTLPVETYTFLSGPFNPSGIISPIESVFGHIVKENEDSILNSTAFQNDSELFFFALPNKVYFLELDTHYISATNADIKFGLDIPSGASYKLATSNFGGSSWTPFTNSSNGESIAFDGALSLSRQSNHYYIVEVGPAGGTVTITFAQNVAQNTLTRLQRGTLLRIFEGGKGGLPPAPPSNFGPFEGYQSIWQSESVSNSDVFFLVGGSPSSGVEVQNQIPALASGTIKKLLVRVLVDGGGRADFWVRKNGADVGTIILAAPSVGIHEVDNIGVTFVKDDLLSFRWRRNSSAGTFDLIPFSEIDWNEDENVQHWYSDYLIKGATSLGFWCPRNGGQINITGNTETDFQVRMKIPGTIRDMVFYGVSPVGGDNTPIMECRVNGIPVATRTLSTGGGRTVQRFDNVNVSFVAGDRVGFSGRSASLATNLDGIMGCKIDF